MKTSNLSKNYSILILIILILILIYIHIPEPQLVMRGGGDVPPEILKEIKADKLYSYTLGHPIIQWVILVVIIGLIIASYFTSIRVFS